MIQAQIYIDKDELKGTQPLQEFILQFLIKQKISGATAFKGQIGFGVNQHLKQPNQLFSFDEVPMLIVFIDEDKKVKHTLTELRKVWRGGYIVTHTVDKWQ